MKDLKTKLYLTLVAPLAFFFQDDPNTKALGFFDFIKMFLKMVWTEKNV